MPSYPLKASTCRISREFCQELRGAVAFAILREVVCVVRQRRRADVSPEPPLVASWFIASQHRYKSVIGPNYQRRLHQFLLKLVCFEPAGNGVIPVFS